MSKKKQITQFDPTIVSEVFIRRVAVLAMAGQSSKKIGEELGLAENAILSIQKGEEYKKLVSRIGEQELTFAVAGMKTKLARMGDKAAKVYEKIMDDYLEGGKNARDAISAAQSVSRALGVDRSEDKPQDATLTVVLPTGAEVLTIPAEKVRNEEEA